MQQRQKEFSDRLEAFKPVSWELIPDFGLYMDQVITYLERVCGGLLIGGERVFTPAMINNYVKFGLVDRPIGKKYGREQLAQLMMICVLKQAASAEGMKLLLAPPEGMTLREHYERFIEQQACAFAEMCASLPLPSAMACALRGAVCHMLCDSVLVRETPPKANEESVKQPANGSHSEPSMDQPQTNEHGL